MNELLTTVFIVITYFNKLNKVLKKKSIFFNMKKRNSKQLFNQGYMYQWLGLKPNAQGVVLLFVLTCEAVKVKIHSKSFGRNT